MQKTMKKLLSIILAILMIVTSVPFAFAADIVDSGTFGADGDNLTWTFDSEGLLTISGEGSMGSFTKYYSTPWYIHRSDVKRLVIEEGVTDVTEYTFYGYNNMTSAVIPDSVTNIKNWAFFDCNSLTNVVIGSGLETVGRAGPFDSVSANCTVHYNGTPEMLNEIKNSDNLPATIHYLSEVGSKEPTCTVNGYINAQPCSTCDFIFGGEIILANGEHNYVNDVCTVCGDGCEHNWQDGACTLCSFACKHSSYTDSKCDVCGKDCEHSVWVEGVCTTCLYACEHSEYTEGICNVCGEACVHSWKDGVCENCELICGHTRWYDGKCSTCRYACTHPEWNGKICAVCSSECAHPEYIYGICSVCKTPCTHSYRSGRCVYCLTECDHSDFADGRCKTCNMVGGALSDNINWYYDGMSGYLVIAGTGDMPVFSNAPWSSYKDTINVIDIREGITSVSANAFPDNTRVTSIILPKTLTTIEEFAFIGCINVSRLILPSGVTTLNANAVNCMSTIHYLGERDNITIIGDLVPALHCCIKTAEEKEATCTENGTTETWYCETCNSQIEGGAVIPASHKTVEVEAKAPTCTEIGWDAYEYCTECDYTTYAEIPVDADAHDWSNLDGICANGCGLECAHEDAYNNLIRPVQNADGTWGKGKIVKICNTCGNSSLVQEVERDHEGYEALEEAAAELEALLNSDELISETKTAYTNNLNHIKRAASSMVYTEIETGLDSMVADINRYIAAIESGLVDGTMRRADLSYMASLFDQVNAIINGDASLIIPSEVGKYWGPYYYYQNQLNNSNLSQVDYNRNMAEYDFENQLIALIAGLEDGTMLKADYTYIDEVIKQIEEKFADEYLTDERKAELEQIKSDIEKLKADPNTSVADLEGLERSVYNIFTAAESCFNGYHDGPRYELTEEAKCGKNAVESATCSFCGKVLTREVENSALTHSFTKYEETEAPKCGVEGKEVAYCDNGCGETDEKAIAALTHKDADGDYICDHGCGYEYEKPAEPTPEAPEDTESEVCEDCGKVHDGFFAELICFFTKIINFIKNLFA